MYISVLSHFTEGVSEVQRGWVLYPNSHSMYRVEPGWRARQTVPEPLLFATMSYLPPGSGYPRTSGSLLVVGWWLPSASCHIDDPSTLTHPRASYLFKVSEGVFRASMQARWTHISYCNHYLRHVLLPEVTDLALTQAENMSNRRQDFQGPPKSSSATVSQDPLEI